MGSKTFHPVVKFSLKELFPLHHGTGVSDCYSFEISKSNFGDSKAPFTTATTPRCREGATLFPGLLHFTFDPYLIMPSVKQGAIKYHLSLWYDATRDH